MRPASRSKAATAVAVALWATPHQSDDDTSRPIDEHNLTGIRPVFSLGDQPCTHWFLQNVIPFLSVTLIAAQEMIEEPSLPNRMGSRLDDLREKLLEHAHPPPKLEIIRSTHKKVQMIGHDYIATNGYVTLLTSLRREFSKGGIYGICC